MENNEESAVDAPQVNTNGGDESAFEDAGAKLSLYTPVKKRSGIGAALRFLSWKATQHTFSPAYHAHNIEKQSPRGAKPSKWHGKRSKSMGTIGHRFALGAKHLDDSNVVDFSTCLPHSITFDRSRNMQLSEGDSKVR